MKTRLLFLLLSVSLYANTPSYHGSHLGNYAGVLKNWFKVTYHTFGWVSVAYLEKNGAQDPSQWVVDKKASLIQEAKLEAQKLAQKREAKYYLIDNISFEVIHTPQKVIVYLDCNLVISD